MYVILPQYSNYHQICQALLFKTVYNVQFRHRGIPGKFQYKATDWALWKHVEMGNPLKAVAELHWKLGSSTMVRSNLMVQEM